ncbi:ATP-dependent DNA helicase chl1 [Gurleya vavrai]
MHEFAHLDLYDIQKEFIQKARNIISQRKFGIFSSPTGTGKTLSLLCSISKFTNQEDEVSNLSKENQALMEELFGKQEKKCKTFYCSRTHDQLNQAIKELKKVNKNVNAIIVGSRKLYCVNENINKTNDVNIINEKCKELLNNDQCKYYNNTFDEIEDIAANRIKNLENIVDIESIKSFSSCHSKCPYFLSKEYARDCDIIFLPYSLLFSKEGRLSLGIEISDSIIVVDEAHNLYDTLIQMNTVCINLDNLKKYEKAFTDYKNRYIDKLKKENLDNIKKIIEILKKLITFLYEYHSEIESQNEKFDGFYTVSEFLVKSGLYDYNMLQIEDFILINNLVNKLEGFGENLNNQLYNILKFLRSLVYSDENGRIFYNKNNIQFSPLDPLIYFEDILDCKSLILAGGTMEPINELQRVLDGREIEYHSFSSICNNFSSHILAEGPTKKTIKLNFENKEDLEIINEIFRCILNLTNLIKKGGTICFIPSKNYLKILKENVRKFKFKKIIVFDDECGFEEFKKINETENVILFGVMGGKMSEGINFSDDLCRLLIIVGVPYPTFNIELQEKIKYYGKDYPKHVAMKTVNQTLGRALRHKNDWGSIVLLDSRFLKLKDYFSPWIKKKLKNCSFPEIVYEVAQLHKKYIK